MGTNVCFPSEHKKEFVEAINSGVGDDVKRNLRNERIDPRYSNSKGNSVYDYINRNIRELKLNRFTTEYAKVNGWKYLPIFDNYTGYIYLLMKKSRYEGLLVEKKRKEKKGEFSHYAYSSAKILNKDVQQIYEQISVYLPAEDENKMLKKVESMLNDLHIPRDIVNRFGLILFETSDFELTSIKCFIPDSNFKINYEEGDSWEQYIPHQESIIPDVLLKDDADKEPNAAPSTLLKLTSKSRKKQGQEPIGKTKEEKSKEEKDRK